MSDWEVVFIVHVHVCVPNCPLLCWPECGVQVGNQRRCAWLTKFTVSSPLSTSDAFCATCTCVFVFMIFIHTHTRTHARTRARTYAHTHSIAPAARVEILRACAASAVPQAEAEDNSVVCQATSEAGAPGGLSAWGTAEIAGGDGGQVLEGSLSLQRARREWASLSVTV